MEECFSLLRSRDPHPVRGNHDQVFLDCVRSGGAPGSEYEQPYGLGLRRSLETASAECRSFLAATPLEHRFEVEARRLFLCHGAPWDPLDGRIYPDFREWERLENLSADYLVVGHTHYQFSLRHGELTVINPGSVGQARDRSGAACCAILDLPSGQVEMKRIPYDATALIEDSRLHDPGHPYLADVLGR